MYETIVTNYMINISLQKKRTQLKSFSLLYHGKIW